MSFNDVLAKPVAGTPVAPAAPTPTSGFASVLAPAPSTTPKISVPIAQETAQAVQQAKQANSISGLFKNAVGSIKDAVMSAVNPNNVTPSQYVAQSWDQLKTYETGVIEHPIKTFNDSIGSLPKAIVDAASSSFTKAVGQAGDTIAQDESGNGSPAGDVAMLANVAAGVAGILFSPISGAFSTAQKIPVLKQAADLLNIPFTITGVAGKLGTDGLLDAVPSSVLSEESKATLRQPLEDLGSLAAQIVIGGKIMDKVSSIVSTGKIITPKVATKIVAEVKEENAPVFEPENHPDAQTPIPHTMTHEEYAKSMGYEPLVPNESLPIIKFGPKTASDVPSVSLDSAPDTLSTTKTRTDALSADDRANVIQETRRLFGKGMSWSDASEHALNKFETDQQLAGKKTSIVPIDETNVSKTQLFHGADKETAASIRSSGFRASKDFPGYNRVSLTPDRATAAHYGSEVLPVEINTDNTKVYSSMDEYTKALEKAPGKTAGEKETALNDPYDTVVIKGKAAADDLVLAKPESASVPKEVEKITPSKTGGTSESGLAAGVKADAIAAGLKDSIGKLPQYGRVDMDEQAKLAKELIDQDPDLAMRVARGEANSPIAHLLPEAVFTALRKIARDTKDPGLFKRLSEHSNTTEIARVMGQRIKALDSGVREDALDVINQVKDAREATVEKKSSGSITRAKMEIAADIKAEIKKAVSPRQSWDEFIKEVQCKY